MSDGTKIFDALKSDGPGISPNQEFASGVDAEMQSQMFPGSDPARGPPKKTFKRPKGKKSKQTSDDVKKNGLVIPSVSNQLEPGIVEEAVNLYPDGVSEGSMIQYLEPKILN